MADFVKLNGYNVKDLTARQEIEKLNLYKNNSNTIKPLMLGDYYAKGEQAQNIVKVGNYLYSLSSNNYNNNGTMRKFDLATNRLLETKTITMGHGNSMCFNRNDRHFYIAPVSVYNNGIASSTTAIYKYDENFENLEVINAPQNMFFTTYDFITNKHYFGRINNLMLELYTYDENLNEFELLSNTIKVYENDFFTTYYKWQDIAVYDNKLYISDIHGIISIYDLTINQLIQNIIVDSIESNNIYNLGELEGMEFDENGILLACHCLGCSNLININLGYYYASSSAVITQIPLPQNNIYYAQSIDRFNSRATYNVDSSFENIFKLETAQLHSINQIFAINEPVSLINIYGNVDLYDAYFINDNITLKVLANATLNIKSTQQIRGSVFALFGEPNSIINIDFAAPVFNCEDRNNIIFIALRGTLNGYSYADYDFVATGYFRTIVNLGALGGVPSFKINNRQCTNYTLTVGGQTLTFTQ